MHGSVKTPTFLRLATEPRAGHTTLTLSAAVSGWKIGDRLVLPDTRHIKESEVTGGGWVNAVNQWEERTVQAISADGRTLTLNSALQYDHLGARDLNGVLDFLPHVGNLTRNVVDPIGESRRHPRAHAEHPHGRRGHPLRPVQGPGTHDVSAAEHHDQPHRPLPDPHASPERPAAHSGQRLPVHAAGQRRGWRLGRDEVQVGHHGPRQPLRADPGQRRLQLQRRGDRDRGRVGKLQRVRPQLRAAGHGRAQRLRVRGAHGDGHRGRRLLVQGAEQLRQKQRRGQLSEPDDGSRVRIRLPVPLPGQHRGPEFQRGRYHHGDGPIHDQERQQHAAPPIREQRSVWRHAGRVHATGGSARSIRSPPRTRRKASSRI